MYYLFGENTVADQLCSYCTAAVTAQLICALVFAYMQKAGFLMTLLISGVYIVIMDDGFAQTQALDFNDSEDETDDEATPSTKRPPVRSCPKVVNLLHAKLS